MIPTRSKKWILLLTVTMLIVGISCAKEKKKMPTKTYGYTKELPSFSLKDADGKAFSDEDVIKEGAVMVVTAPILSAKKDQEGWESALNDSRSGAKGKLVFIEDLSVSSFKDTARNKMKEEYKNGEEPILLIDEKGSVREKLGVKEKDTVVLVYDKDRKLIHVETGEPSQELGAKAWAALKK